MVDLENKLHKQEYQRFMQNYKIDKWFEFKDLYIKIKVL